VELMESQETLLGDSSPAGGCTSVPARRLVIQKMTLENFKSYAGQVTIGPFQKNMTSVVGPNGSGKSNVIDAMLFVFGWRANKMRQSKVSELIHKSEQHPALQFAKVCVYFQDIIDTDEVGFDVVPDSQLVVSREARIDNTSKYWVDGKASNFKEVTALLRKRGIDLDHNRFLILQGEVEQIAMMKPKAPSQHEDGLLEYLEDIIGSNRHVEPIGEALKQIEDLNEHRTTKLNSLNAVEQQMESLEGRKAEAETYVRTEAQLHDKQSAFYQKNVAQCNRVVADTEAKAARLEEQLRDEREKKQLNNQKLSELEKAYKKGKREHEKGAAQLEKSRSEFQSFEREDVKHRQELKHLKAQLKKAQAAIDRDGKKHSELKHAIASRQSDVPRLDQDEQALSSQKSLAEAELAAMYDGLKGQTEPLRRKIEAQQREREPQAQLLATLQSDQTLVTSELQLFEDKVSGAAAAVKEAKRELLEHSVNVDLRSAELQACNAKCDANKQRLQELQERQQCFARDETPLVDDARSKRAKYEDSRAAQASASSQSTQMKALMQAKTDGSIAGIIGRLGSLGSIRPEYDVAISTACGALDHIVVRDTDTAQQCVELLRKRDLGVATFIVLDKQRHLQDRMRQIDVPKGSRRLFDLVDCSDKELKVAFYFALRDTLVCEDKTLANQIATGGSRRWRVVTTDGVVINASGTMEGGGKPIHGKMSSHAPVEALSESDLADLLKQANSAEERLEVLRATHADTQAELRSLSKETAQNQNLHKKLTMQLNAASTQRMALEQRLTRAQDAGSLSGAEEQQKHALEHKLKEMQGKLGKQKSVVDVLDAALAKLQEEVLEVGGIKLRAQKSKVETLGEQLAGVQQAITKAKVEVEAQLKGEVKLESSITKQQAEAATLEEKIQNTTAHLKTLEDQAFEVMQQYERCQEELATKENVLKGLQDEYEEFKSVVAKVLTVEVEMASQAEDYQRSIKEHMQKVRHWEQKLQALREAAAQGAELLASASEEAENGDEPGSSSTFGSLLDLSAEELDALDVEQLQADIAELEEAISGMSPNLSVISEYRARSQEWRARLKDFDDVTAQRDAQRRTYEDLRKQRLDEFMTGFRIIGLRLKEMYQMITLGGDAELELVDSLDPFTEGIVFSVRPPKKSWKNISNLSGGEKTLSSLALVFALHHYKPTPLYVMDEIDAALDFRNVSIVGNYIKERTRNAQFIIISLRNNMFELADRLVGIYKTSNCTKSVAIDPKAFTIAAR